MNFKEKYTKFNHLIEKKGNLIKINFKKYQSHKLIDTSIKKAFYNFKKTPKQLWKDFLKHKTEEIDIHFEEFINYLKENQIWDESKSISLRIDNYLKKMYGYNKIQELLKFDNYNESLIKEELKKIPNQIWEEQIQNIINKIKKVYSHLDKDKLIKKIYNKLQYLGFRNEEIEKTIDSLKKSL
jgi:SOS response regulatory protein OraA/RecX